MIIGVLKEIKQGETRVALLPEGVKALVKAGHSVNVEFDAGSKIGITDRDYEDAGAAVCGASYIWRLADMIVKVKEPQVSEYDFLKPYQTIFTYLHLAVNPDLVKVLLEKKIRAVDYATVEMADGSFPLLRPMSEIAGRLAVQIGARYLQKDFGGKGVLLAGVGEAPPAKVLIVGAGNVGTAAAEVAVGMGARVYVFDKEFAKIERLWDRLKTKVCGYHGFSYSIYNRSLKKLVSQTDLLIGAALIPGAKTPKVITKEMVESMEPGSVVIDVSIDQGGCIETTRPTCHSDPVYQEFGVTHYCVTNMPALVGRTSTRALTSATLPYILELADKSSGEILNTNPALAKGINIFNGRVTYKSLAKDLGYEYTPLAEAMTEKLLLEAEKILKKKMIS